MHGVEAAFEALWHDQNPISWAASLCARSE
jgi:hypothetical protein